MVVPWPPCCHITPPPPNRTPLLLGCGSDSMFPCLSVQGVTPDKIYHVTVMPCYDKKLEASRPDFFNQEHQTRDVDCVVTTGLGPATLSPHTFWCGPQARGIGWHHPGAAHRLCWSCHPLCRKPQGLAGGRDLPSEPGQRVQLSHRLRDL